MIRVIVAKLGSCRYPTKLPVCQCIPLSVKVRSASYHSIWFHEVILLSSCGSQSPV